MNYFLRKISTRRKLKKNIGNFYITFINDKLFSRKISTGKKRKKKWSPKDCSHSHSLLDHHEGPTDHDEQEQENA